jgi:hypothetical protein
VIPKAVFRYRVNSSLADNARFTREAMTANVVASEPGRAVRAISTSIGTMASWLSGAPSARCGPGRTAWPPSSARSTSLNITYDVGESRPCWKQRLLAIVLTVVFPSSHEPHRALEDVQPLRALAAIVIPAEVGAGRAPLEMATSTPQS